MEPLLSVAKVAELWDCSRQHVYNLIHRGVLTSVQVGENGSAFTRVPESAAVAYIEANTVKGRVA